VSGALDLRAASFETERLLVRTCQPGDASGLAELMTPEVSRWVAAWPAPLSVEVAAGIVAAQFDAAAAGRAFPAVLVERATGKLVGWLKVELTGDVPRTAELSYWVGEPFQRRGFAFEAASRAVAWAFSDLGAEVVTAGAQVGNDASLRLLARLGLHPVGCRDVWAPARQRFEACEFWSRAAMPGQAR
jgi:RimJ/RimL family protein N-acetyltransferase